MQTCYLLTCLLHTIRSKEFLDDLLLEFLVKLAEVKVDGDGGKGGNDDQGQQW